MSTVEGSLREDQQRLAGQMRERHKTWIEIAGVFRDRYSLNARVAHRLAHGWTQREAADEWNRRWPADPKTFKNFSYWELWPARTGHAPSLGVLARLAALYECRVADLVVDCADFRYDDAEYQARANLARLPAIVTGEPPGALELRSADADGHRGDPDNAQDHDPLTALFRKVEEMSAEELAHAVASWTAQDGSGPTRRSLLLKLSAGLALAAADPVLADTDVPSPWASALADPVAGANLAGIWHSRYTYYSSSQGQEYDGQHYMALRQRGTHLTGQSLPHSTGSRLSLRLSVNGAIATGTWTELTSPSGYYKGAEYHGTIQLVVNPMGRAMTGRWLGYGKNFEINTGTWELAWVDGSTSPNALRQYHLKA